MEWSKAKSLLILLMLAVNIFLGVNIYTQIQAGQVQEVNMTKDACALLEKRGIEVSEDSLLDLPVRMQSWTWVRDTAAEQQAAERLLGTCTAESPGGGIYAYAGSGGTVIFRSGGYVELQPAKGETALDPAALLAPQGENTRLMMESSDGGYLLKLDGYAVSGALVSEGEDGAWSGTWIFAAVREAGDESLSRAKLILSAAQLLENYGLRSIERIECVYVLSALQNGDIRLVPIWQIESGETILRLNTLTGAELVMQ